MFRKLTMLIFVLMRLCCGNVSAEPIAVTEIALEDGGLKIGDGQDAVVRCLGRPRGVASLPDNQAWLLFCGGGKVELVDGAVSKIMLPSSSGVWNVWTGLSKSRIEANLPSVYRWAFLVDDTRVGAGLWSSGAVTYKKQKFGGTTYRAPSEPAPFMAYFMKYRSGVLVLSETNGVKRVQLSIKDGRAEGPSCFWHPDGSLSEKGDYDRGVKSGEWASWTLNGGLTKWKHLSGHSAGTTGFSQSIVWPPYDLNCLVEQDVRWTVERAGCPDLAGVWKKDERIPFAEEIYDSAESVLTLQTLAGSKLMQLTIKRGDLDGKSVRWNSDGTLLREGAFKNNVRFGIWKFYTGDTYSTFECDGRNNWK